MPRWLHFILGFVTLIVLVSAVSRFIVRHMPESWLPGSWAYDAWVAVVAVDFVLITVRAAKRQGEK